jgi:hypothetical protein
MKAILVLDLAYDWGVAAVNSLLKKAHSTATLI